MTEPKTLSPAAQAVLNAFGTADHIAGDLIPALAAALRAAAEGVREAYVNDVDFYSADQWLDAIAAELEGAQ